MTDSRFSFRYRIGEPEKRSPRRSVRNDGAELMRTWTKESRGYAIEPIPEEYENPRKIPEILRKGDRLALFRHFGK